MSSKYQLFWFCFFVLQMIQKRTKLFLQKKIRQSHWCQQTNIFFFNEENSELVSTCPTWGLTHFIFWRVTFRFSGHFKHNSLYAHDVAHQRIIFIFTLSLQNVIQSIMTKTVKTKSLVALIEIVLPVTPKLYKSRIRLFFGVQSHCGKYLLELFLYILLLIKKQAKVDQEVQPITERVGSLNPTSS